MAVRCCGCDGAIEAGVAILNCSNCGLAYHRQCGRGQSKRYHEAWRLICKNCGAATDWADKAGNDQEDRGDPIKKALGNAIVIVVVIFSATAALGLLIILLELLKKK